VFVVTVRNWPVAQVGPVRDATRPPDKPAAAAD
jgi:hypothetical protein